MDSHVQTWVALVEANEVQFLTEDLDRSSSVLRLSDADDPPIADVVCRPCWTLGCLKVKLPRWGPERGGERVARPHEAVELRDARTDDDDTAFGRRTAGAPLGATRRGTHTC